MKKTKKAATQYTIDLDIKGMLFFVVLALLTAVVVFYLGVLFGKATRDPTTGKPVAIVEDVTEERIAEDKITASDLEIYNIRNEEDTLSNLKKSTQSVLEEADRVINQSKKIQGEATQPQAKPQKPVVKQTTGAGQWPDQPTPSSLPKGTFTVQVFATKDKDKADRIVRSLRQQRFDAYLAQVVIENQTIYRVRVGRKSKAEIGKLDKELQKVIGGMGMKSRVIKLN